MHKKGNLSPRVATRRVPCWTLVPVPAAVTVAVHSLQPPTAVPASQPRPIHTHTNTPSVQGVLLLLLQRQDLGDGGGLGGRACVRAAAGRREGLAAATMPWEDHPAPHATSRLGSAACPTPLTHTNSIVDPTHHRRGDWRREKEGVEGLGVNAKNGDSSMAETSAGTAGVAAAIPVTRRVRRRSIVERVGPGVTESAVF